ncbi:MAG: flavin reductase family protein [Chloroflexota bacterium]|nr:flavin reductase family protein [Chloroflexota bacterium]
MGHTTINGAGEFYHHYPRTATIVAVRARGGSNCMAVAWHCSLSKSPPLYGVSLSPKRLTLGLIMEAGEFSVNFMPLEKAELIASVGGVSGTDTDKFERFDIATVAPLKTQAPVLAEAYACYECRLVEHRTYGDHVWLVGEVLATHYAEGLFTAEQVVDVEKVAPALYLGAELYTTTDRRTVRHLDRKVYGKR